VDVLFRFAATSPDHPLRLRILSDSVHAGNPPDSVLMERLEALLGMLALLMRVVLVADELEGFSTDETAALRLAAFLGSLRHSVERLDVILSLNLDIWQSAFLPKLSGGLADRLSEVVVELEPLTEEEMVALLNSRAPGLGERILSRIDRKQSGSHARGVIRAAGQAWSKAMETEAPPAAVVFTPPPPAPVEITAGKSFVIEHPPLESPPPEIAPQEPETALPAPSGPPVFVAEPPPEPPSEPAPSPDRVDELLRQFRERYGRGGA
jgi:hypothetical protein